MDASIAEVLKAQLDRGECPRWEQSLCHPEQIRIRTKTECWGGPVEEPCVSLPLRGPIPLVICGGGHVAQALAAAASAVGFPITVLEDRPEVLEQGAFPPETTLRLGSMTELIAAETGSAQTFYAVMTRSHEENRRCLRAVLEKPHGYAGMLGSRRDAADLRRWLVEDGVPEETVARLHHPIGLDIGAESPAEIAAAVTAELIACRAALGGGSRLESSVLEGLNRPPYAWVMLVETKGITPRKPGACMLVHPDGSICGTIGGGAREAAAIRQALDVLRTRKAGWFTYPDCKAPVQCGGIVTYTIVPVKEEKRDVEF